MATLTDKELIESLGYEALKGAGYTHRTIQKWMQRGIPWRERDVVQEIAEAKGIELPPNFRRQRTARPEGEAA